MVLPVKSAFYIYIELHYIGHHAKNMLGPPAEVHFHRQIPVAAGM